MDTTFQNPSTSWRAVNSETVHHITYIAIILTEAVIAIMLWIASFRCTASLKKTKEEYAASKSFGEIGLALGVLFFLTVFINIGGEWFLMWQSEMWNTQPTAFAMIGIQLLILIYYKMPEDGGA